MAYIYKITNDINQKIYIGKTEFSIERRFKEHCRDAFKDKNENRPLYAAMRKYGIEHFHIEQIEKTDNPEEREKYWIEQYRSFKNGYNATLGGDGKKYLDYDILIQSYLKLQNIQTVATLYHCDSHYLSQILKENGINVLSSKQVNIIQQGHLINQYDLNNNFLKCFPSARAAARAVSKETTNLGGAAGHIMAVCKGKRKTAYGYIWRFAN